jgi:hypothetical protein
MHDQTATRTADWLLLITTLPTKNATARMRLWRAVKAQGCATLRDGAYLLPATSDAEPALARLAAETTAAGGAAHLLRVKSRNAAQEKVFRDLFDRSAEYRALLDAIANSRKDDAAALRTLKGLRRDFETIVAVDFFPGEAQAQAQAALADLEAVLLRGEPHAAQKKIKRLEGKDYTGRTWATRKHMWVDRMASAWLIRRFIDRKARFLWLDKPQDCPKKALGFDFDGATFTHVGARVTFEVLIASFGLDDDPSLVRIGALVHYLDVGGVPVETAAGIELLLGGLRNRCADDDALLREAARIFDSLYEASKTE